MEDTITERKKSIRIKIFKHKLDHMVWKTMIEFTDLISIQLFNKPNLQKNKLHFTNTNMPMKNIFER